MKYFWIAWSLVCGGSAIFGIVMAAIKDDIGALHFSSTMLVLTGICLLMLARRMRHDRRAS